MTTTEVERKKQKKIDNNHWMCKIQKHVFNIDAPNYYMGYCPFFWMTWVAVICFPVVIPVRVVGGAIVKALTKLDESAGKSIQTYKTNKRIHLETIPLEPTYSDLLNVDKYINMVEDITSNADALYNSLSYTRFDIRRMLLWFEKHPDWRSVELVEAKKYLEKVEERNRKARERAANIRRITNMVPVCGVAIFKCLIPILIIAICIAFGWGIVLLAKMFTILMAVQVFIGIILVSFAIVFIKTLYSFVDIVVCDMMEKRTKPFWFTKAVIWFAQSVGGVFTFLTETVKMSYKQECPLIIWGEETGKIEKRVKQ